MSDDNVEEKGRGAQAKLTTEGGHHAPLPRCDRGRKGLKAVTGRLGSDAAGDSGARCAALHCRRGHPDGARLQ
eukprot:1031803-Pyramimonas_sp.AAC.1